MAGPSRDRFSPARYARPATPDPDLTRQRHIVNAFFAAARDGDFDALIAALDPDVVLRADGGAARARHTVAIHGARAVSAQALTFTRLAPFVRPALINGAAGVVVAAGGRALSVMGFTVAHGKIVTIDVIADPDRLRQLDLAVQRLTRFLRPAGVTKHMRRLGDAWCTHRQRRPVRPAHQPMLLTGPTCRAHQKA